MRSIIPMEEVGMHSPELGNKVKNLAHLTKINIRVPRGFGLCYRVYEQHVAPLLDGFKDMLKHEQSYKATAFRIREQIISHPLSEADNIVSALRQHIPGVEYFAVRSSGAPVVQNRQVAEDSQESSLAGQYESYLLVPLHRVPDAILNCFASLFAERCLRQFDVKNDEGYLRSRMSVLVQEMCLADICGVAMTRDYLEDDKEVFGVELAYGACEAIVSGQTQGDMHLLERKSGMVVSSALGSKQWRVNYEPLLSFDAPNKIRKVVPEEQRREFAATPNLVRRIFDLGMEIERYFGTPQDIELVVSDGKIVITQTRPITCLPNNN